MRCGVRCCGLLWNLRAWRLVLVLCFVVLGAAPLREYYAADLIVQPLSVSVGLDRAGIGATALTQLLAEHLANLTVSTDTIQRSHISPALTEASLDIEIPETKLSLKTVAEFIRHWLPFRTVPVVSGDALLVDGKCSLTLRISSGKEANPADTWSNSANLKDIDALVEDGAMFALER